MSRTIFTNVNVVGRDASSAQQPRTVVVEGDRIVAVGGAAKAAPVEARVIDGRRKFLIPGLSDGHVHFQARSGPANKAIAALFLAHGVTSVYCMHGSAGVLRLQRQIADGEVPGPRILSTGPMQNDATLTFERGRRRAHDQARRGYASVKVYNWLSRDGFDGLCQGAEEAGIDVVGHVLFAMDPVETLGTRQSAIVHAEEIVKPFFDFDIFGASDAEDRKLDLDQLPDLAERVLESDMTVVPTIQHFWSIKCQSEDEAAWLRRPEMALLPRVTRDSWQGQRHYSRMFPEPYHIRRIDACARAQMGLIRVFAEAGIPLVAGTDALAWGSVPGTSLHDELAYYLQAGLPIEAVIETATVNAAKLFKIPGLGRIEPAAPADLVLLNSDPRDSLANLRDIAGVMANGRWHTAAELWDLHAKAVADAARMQ